MIGQSPVFSVSDFVAVFNQSIEMLYPSVVITGELSNFRVSKNKWVYFDLKDENSSVKFFGSVYALPGPLEDGMVLEVFGAPRLHNQFGFSVNVQSVKAVGEGSINKAYLLLKNKLEKEGLFLPERKREIPFPPEKIGLITSVESAAYGDFSKIVNSRWPSLEVQVFDVNVQGRDAVEQIIESIKSANQQGDIDCLVIIRGGGSKDELSVFDNEQLVREISASRLPTMVAVGHERDIALSEMVSDVRASTPSNAVEMLVPDYKSEISWLKSVDGFVSHRLTSYQDEIKKEIDYYEKTAGSLLVEAKKRSEVFLEQASRLLIAYDPDAPLKRGYALPLDSDGVVIRNSVLAKQAKAFSLKFVDGILDVEAK